MAAATVGTTNRSEMFSPASNGSVQILVIASRPLLACSVDMTGTPALSATNCDGSSGGRVGSLRSFSRKASSPDRPYCTPTLLIGRRALPASGPESTTPKTLIM